MSVDTETISLTDRTCIGIGVAIPEAEYYFQILPQTTEALPILAEILSDPNRQKVYFNALFDLRVLEQTFTENGLPPPDARNIVDVSIMAQVQGRESGELNKLAELYLGPESVNPYSIKQLLLDARGGKRGGNMLEVPFEVIALKNWYDTRQTLALKSALERRFPTEASRDCYDVDNKLVASLLSVEAPGLQIDHRRLEEHYVRLSYEVNGYREICDRWGFNPSSPQQVGYVLAANGNFLPFTRGGRSLVTDEDALESIAAKEPLARLILSFRKQSKLLSTYVVPFRQADRAYTHFRIDLATGRLASGAFGKAHKHVCRNQQNIPNKMRDIYLPDTGIFTWFDYSQIEMRLLAFMSHDENMMAAYQNGWSIHEMTMKELWPHAVKKDSEGYDTIEYLTSKTFNFAMAYYAMDTTLAKHTKLPVATCSEYKSRWLDFYSGAKRFMLDCMASKEPTVVSDFGRVMRLPDIEEMRKRSEDAGNKFNARGAQNHIDKCKINYRIQGTAADIIKRAMLSISTLPGVRLQVHDEIVADGAVAFPDSMERIHPDIRTPFEVHSGPIWQ